jgi:flavin-dependent dehydrogenase
VLVDPGTVSTARLELLPPSGLAVIEALQLEDLLADELVAQACFGIRRRWANTRTVIEDFLRHPRGKGFVIDRSRFDLQLRNAASEAGVQFVAGRVTRVESGAGFTKVHVSLPSEKCAIDARLAVDATGRASALSRRLGAKRMVHERLVAERRRTPSGAGAAAPVSWLEVEGLGPGWSYSISGPGRREDWDVFRGHDRRLRSDKERVDASSASLTHAAGDGWIAIGDAATSFDPVTSQGLTNALVTALVAAGILLSPDGLDGKSIRAYSDSVRAAFHNSEQGRVEVYRPFGR